MSGQPYRVEVESIHWRTLLPSLRLFDAFRHAIHPSKLLLAYLFVALLVLGGQALDLIWGTPIYRDEVSEYQRLDPAQFERWQELQEGYERSAVTSSQSVGKFGVFDTLVAAELAAFRRGLASALNLDFGLTRLFSGGGAADAGVLGALAEMFLAIPAWLLTTRPLFFAIYALYAYALLALFGGAISRLAALHAARDVRPAPPVGVRFAVGWYVWFLIAPLLPLLIAAVFCGILALSGLLFFNLPVLDVLGGLLYGPLMISGFLITVILLGLAVGAHVLYPGIAIEGTDAFDAISRAYNYVLGRPVRFLLYAAVSLVYFALTFFLVSLIVYGTIWATAACIDWGAFAETAPNVERFDAIAPDATFNGPTASPAWPSLGPSGQVAATLVSFWIKALLLVLPAFAVSFYFCAATNVYLLLRRSADGVEFEDIYLDEPQRVSAPVESEASLEETATAPVPTTAASAAPVAPPLPPAEPPHA